MTPTQTQDTHSLNSHINESEFATVLSSIGDGVVVTDAELCIVAFNSTAETILGKKEEEVLGERIDDQLSLQDEHAGAIDFDFSAVTTNGAELGRNEDTFVRQQNTAEEVLVPVTLFGAPILNDQGAVKGAVFTIRDVSREYEINRMKSEFVSIVSHQLRTPLSAIKWFLETLIENKQGDPLSDRQEDYLEQAFQSNERMISLINDLLNVSRLEAGKIRNEKEEVQLEVMFASVLKEISTFAHANNVELDCTFCDGELPTVFVDPGKVRQVVQNLISNGVKYSKGKSTLKIDAQVDEDKIIFSIADQGIGISAEDQARLFEPFFRAANAIATQAEGSGLGLYICRMLLEMNGGEIWVESTVGEGTTFFFSLPILKK